MSDQFDRMLDLLDAKDAEITRLTQENERMREALEWQWIGTAPKTGKPVDLWGINHLHYAKRGERVTNVTFGTVRDWLGNEREDWQHGRGEDFEPTHWRPIPDAPIPIPDPAGGMPVEVKPDA